MVYSSWGRQQESHLLPAADAKAAELHGDRGVLRPDMLCPFQRLHGPAKRLRGNCLAAGARLLLLAFEPAACAHILVMLQKQTSWACGHCSMYTYPTPPPVPRSGWDPGSHSTLQGCQAEPQERKAAPGIGVHLAKVPSGGAGARHQAGQARSKPPLISAHSLPGHGSQRAQEVVALGKLPRSCLVSQLAQHGQPGPAGVRGAAEHVQMLHQAPHGALQVAPGRVQLGRQRLQGCTAVLRPHRRGLAGRQRVGVW